LDDFLGMSDYEGLRGIALVDARFDLRMHSNCLPWAVISRLIV
jgi:hypothetical protein